MHVKLNALNKFLSAMFCGLIGNARAKKIAKENEENKKRTFAVGLAIGIMIGAALPVDNARAKKIVEENEENKKRRGFENAVAEKCGRLSTNEFMVLLQEGDDDDDEGKQKGFDTKEEQEKDDDDDHRNQKAVDTDEEKEEGDNDEGKREGLGTEEEDEVDDTDNKEKGHDVCVSV